MNRIYAGKFLVFSLLFSTHVFAAELIEGDASAASGDTFTFPIGVSAVYSLNLPSVSVFAYTVGAGQAVANNSYAVAQALRGYKRFVPLAPVGSALNGKKINFLNMYGSLPVVVEDAVQKIYLYTRIDSSKGGNPEVTIINTSDINDAGGAQVTSGIMGLANGVVSHDSAHYIFAPVKGNGAGDFGNINSGIALAKEQATLELLDATTGLVGNKAAKFDGTIDALKINEDVIISGNIVDMYFDNNLERLYVATQVASGGAGGARSVAVGRVVDGVLTFAPIAPDGAITGNNQIIATGDGSETVVARKVRTMRTTTGLDYLLVCGGNSSDLYFIRALPLVNEIPQGGAGWQTSATHGTLADYNQDPKKSVYHNNVANVNIVNGKYCDTPATTPAGLLTDDLQSVVVGLNSIPISGGVSEIFTSEDSVFVAISSNYSVDSVPGLFESHAIFDDKGRVASWTRWKRVGGNNAAMFGAGFDSLGLSSQGALGPNFWYATDGGGAMVNKVYRSIWGQGSGDGLLGGTSGNSGNGLVALVESSFEQKNGGVQCVEEFVQIIGDATDLGLNNVSLLCVGGSGKLALAQTGQKDISDDIFKPTKGDFATDSVFSTDGSFPTATSNTRFLTIAGGAISEIGIVTCAAIAKPQTGGYYLVVGGTSGVAVLCNNTTGEGWTMPLAGLYSVPAGMSFKKISSTSFVKKLVAVDDKLYMLTPDELKEIVLVPEKIVSNNVDCISLANRQTVGLVENGHFADVLISAKNDQDVSLALLATTQGLYRLSNGNSLYTATEASNLSWTRIDLPEGVGPVFALSPLALYDVGWFAYSGQVYVHSAYQGYYSSRAHRLYVNLGDAITDDTVRLVDDQFIENKNSYFADLGQFHSTFFPDGGLFFFGRSNSRLTPTELLVFPSQPVLSTTLLSDRDFSTPIVMSFGQNGLLRPMMRLSTLGSWIVPGEFGMRVSE
jgi:hypothetical protein